MSAKHTQVPWQVNHRDKSQVCDADGEVRGCAPIALCQGGTLGENRANARRIVQCVNAHDELVAALKQAIEATERRTAGIARTDWVAAARAAIKKAA